MYVCCPSIDRLPVESPDGWLPGWLMVVSGRRSSHGLLPKYLLPAERALMDPDLYGLSCGSQSAQLGLLWQGRQLVDIFYPYTYTYPFSVTIEQLPWNPK